MGNWMSLQAESLELPSALCQQLEPLLKLEAEGDAGCWVDGEYAYVIVHEHGFTNAFKFRASVGLESAWIRLPAFLGSLDLPQDIQQIIYLFYERKRNARRH